MEGLTRTKKGDGTKETYSSGGRNFLKSMLQRYKGTEDANNKNAMAADGGYAKISLMKPL